MDRALSRRSLVAAAPAAIVAASLPAIAAGINPDAALLALREPYERTMAGMDEVSPAHSRAEEAYMAAKRAQPHLDERALRKLRKLCGLTIAERAWRRAVDANGAVIVQITETPAHTLAGVIFKARVAEADSLNPDLAASIVADLVAIGGADA